MYSTSLFLPSSNAHELTLPLVSKQYSYLSLSSHLLRFPARAFDTLQKKHERASSRFQGVRRVFQVTKGVLLSVVGSSSRFSFPLLFIPFPPLSSVASSTCHHSVLLLPPLVPSRFFPPFTPRVASDSFSSPSLPLLPLLPFPLVSLHKPAGGDVDARSSELHLAVVSEKPLLSTLACSRVCPCGPVARRRRRPRLYSRSPSNRLERSSNSTTASFSELSSLSLRPVRPLLVSLECRQRTRPHLRHLQATRTSARQNTQTTSKPEGILRTAMRRNWLGQRDGRRSGGGGGGGRLQWD